MESSGYQMNVDFTVNENDLYREETFMDLKIAQIRRLTPVKPDGSNDESRSPIFVGYTKVMSSNGPISLHHKINALSLEEAVNKFPHAMNNAVKELSHKTQQ